MKKWTVSDNVSNITMRVTIMSVMRSISSIMLVVTVSVSESYI